MEFDIATQKFGIPLKRRKARRGEFERPSAMIIIYAKLKNYNNTNNMDCDEGDKTRRYLEMCSRHCWGMVSVSEFLYSVLCSCLSLLLTPNLVGIFFSSIPRVASKVNLDQPRGPRPNLVSFPSTFPLTIGLETLSPLVLFRPFLPSTLKKPILKSKVKTV